MPISKNKIIFKTPAAARAWARRFAAALSRTDVLALIGPLGAGKTTLVQGLAQGWHCTSAVASPTFSLVNEYTSRRGPMYHMDMYRLSSKEVSFFPLEDYLGAGLCVIEWADRVRERLPQKTHLLNLTAPNEDTRILTISRL